MVNNKDIEFELVKDVCTSVIANKFTHAQLLVNYIYATAVSGTYFFTCLIVIIWYSTLAHLLSYQT